MLLRACVSREIKCRQLDTVDLKIIDIACNCNPIHQFVDKGKMPGTFD
jgi:hypothetical protein